LLAFVLMALASPLGARRYGTDRWDLPPPASGASLVFVFPRKFASEYWASPQNRGAVDLARHRHTLSMYQARRGRSLTQDSLMGSTYTSYHKSNAERGRFLLR
jgi:hypothetical protein